MNTVCQSAGRPGTPVSVDGVAPPGVIVAGMHRSATSLVTSVFAARGWRTSGPMLAPSQHNQRGYFEDRHIHEVHKRVLSGHGASWDSAARLRTLRRRRRGLSLTPYSDDVDGIVAGLRDGGKPWIWKNPRATLFLEDWARRFPEAEFVICLRSPASVVDSMLRRGNTFEVAGSDRLAALHRAARALSVWHTYNVVAYRFARRHPERVTVVRIPEDLPVLATATQPSQFDPALLAGRPRPKIRLFSLFAVTSQLLYLRLRRLHDPYRLAAVLAGPDRKV